MAKHPATGVVNARDAKPPSPPPSPKGFVWPERKRLRNGLYSTLTKSIGEILAERKMTANQLSIAMYGARGEKGNANSMKPYNWSKGKGMPPDETEAAYLAQVLNVPMSRLLEPNTAALPRPLEASEIREAVLQHSPKRPKPPPEDTRWILPSGAPVPRIKIETTDDGLTSVELHGTFPADVAMSVYSLVNSYRKE